MLETLGRLSALCSRYQSASLVFGAGFLVLFIYSIVTHAPGRIDWLVPSAVGFAWSLTFYSFAGLFLRIPEVATSGMGFFRRIGRRMHRFALYVLGVLFIGLTLALLYLSMKMLSIWIGEIP